MSETIPDKDLKVTPRVSKSAEQTAGRSLVLRAVKTSIAMKIARDIIKEDKDILRRLAEKE